jgi:heptosyltransferase-1
MHMRADRSRGPHAVDRVLALAREVCGGEVEARFDLELSRDERARGDELVARFLPETKDAVILALGTPDDVRAWPAEHAANLARRLAANGRSVVVLSGPTERESGAKVELELAGVERVRHWVGQRGLRELAAFFAAAAARGARFVGCDSGPMHLAWTSGLRVICLEGPQSAERTGPWPQGDGSPHVALTARVPPACVPCFARTCEHPNGNVCMRDLAVDDVFEALTS